LHANQRMQLVNFWLVSTAFLSAGYVTAVTGGRPEVAVFVALLGATTSLGFHRLELRTFVLVKASEAAIKVIEEKLANETGIDELRILERVTNRRRFLGSYVQVIRMLYFSAAAAFLGGFVFSLVVWIRR
jgi:hypothetical protein